MTESNTALQGYDLSKPLQALQVAAELQKFVIQQKLTVEIQGKDYPLVEAWQFAGSQLGLYPILIECKNESDYEDREYKWSDKRNNPRSHKTKHFKYRSVVEIRRHADDKVLSRGSMVCTNDEQMKHTFDEYSIESMSQTRAEGKAWRMLLAWVMKAAGFEQTPAEEMDEAKEFYDNCPTPVEKKLLIDLVYSSTLDEPKKTEALATIFGCTDYKLFERIEGRLRSVQPSIDQIVNPSQGDINKHIKQTMTQ
jgi:hypothetical protein